MKKKYLILPLSIIWVTNMYSAASTNSNMGRLARKTPPFFKSAQNSDKRKRWWFIYFTHTLPKLQASLSPRRYPSSCDPSRFTPRKKIIKVDTETADKILNKLSEEEYKNVKFKTYIYLKEKILLVKTTVEDKNATEEMEEEIELEKLTKNVENLKKTHQKILKDAEKDRNKIKNAINYSGLRN